MSLSLCLSVCLSLSLSLNISLSLSLSRYLSFSLFLCLFLSLYLFLTFYLFLSLSVSLSLCISVSVILWFFLKYFAWFTVILLSKSFYGKMSPPLFFWGKLPRKHEWKVLLHSKEENIDFSTSLSQNNTKLLLLTISYYFCCPIRRRWDRSKSAREIKIMSQLTNDGKQLQQDCTTNTYT